MAFYIHVSTNIWLMITFIFCMVGALSLPLPQVFTRIVFKVHVCNNSLFTSKQYFYILGDLTQNAHIKKKEHVTKLSEIQKLRIKIHFANGRKRFKKIILNKQRGGQTRVL